MLLVGTDPEFLLTDGERFISSIGKIPGRKYNPVPTSFGAIHCDNVACEVNVHPSDSAHKFDNIVRKAVMFAQMQARRHGLKLSRQSLGEYMPSELESPESREAGCEPDMCAYSREYNIPPCLETTPLRSAAGHVHIGCEIADEQVCHFVQCCDLIISVASLHHESVDRRQLYGRAGCYRRKPYGVEYRTPSNHWVFHKKRRVWMFEAVERVVNDYMNMGVPQDLQEVINEHKLQRADELCQQYGLKKCPN